MKLVHIDLLFTIAFVENVRCLNILISAEGYNPSHLLFNYRLAKALVDQGHNVTILVHLHFLDLSHIGTPDGVTEYRIPHAYSPEIVRIAQESWNQMSFLPLSPMALFEGLDVAYRQQTEQYKILFEKNGLIEKLKTQRQFDIGLSHPFDVCPLLYFEALGIEHVAYHSALSDIWEVVAWGMGVPILPSYMPACGFSSTNDTMTFWQRIENFGSYAIGAYLEARLIGRYIDLCNKMQPRPSLFELLLKQTAIFANGDEIFQFPRPLPVSTMYFGNLDEHTESLNMALDQKWVDTATTGANGFIIFSLGSLANTTFMPDEMINGMLRAFENFRDYTIIWRLEKSPRIWEGNKHSHVITSNWIPQPQLLAHPRAKLFITHCGYNSFFEAAKSGVPIISIPLFGDHLQTH